MFHDVKSLIWGAKLFGSIPFKINNYKITITKIKISYTIFMSAIMITTVGFAVYFDSNDLDDIKSILLMKTRSGLSCTCFLIDSIITIYLNNYFKSALDHIHVYDVFSKFKYTNHYSNKNICYIIFIIVSTCWISLGYVVYKIDSSYPLFNCFAYIYVYGGTSMQILKFSAIILLLYQRFKHLSEIVLPKFEPKKIKVKIIHKISYDLGLDDIWWLHYNLITAAEEINRLYSFQLLIWIFSFSLNGLSRIYTLITPEDETVFSKLRDILCATGCFINLLIITIFCHITSKKANRVRENVFAPYSIVVKNSHLIQENSPAIVYFCVKKLSFTAASGFIHIHLPLLLSIAGAMTTYLVIIYKSPT